MHSSNSIVQETTQNVFINQYSAIAIIIYVKKKYIFCRFTCSSDYSSCSELYG